MTTPDPTFMPAPVFPPDVEALTTPTGVPKPPLPAQAPVADEPIVAATWQSLPAAEPWCPATVLAHAPGWLADVEAADVHVFADDVAPGWRAVAASVRGRSHAHRGDHREDAFAVRRHDGLVVLCAADGAGSAPLSRVGSELACLETAERVVAKLAPERGYLRERQRDELAHAVGHAIGLSVWETCRLLHDLAAASGTSPSAYRCTLLVAAWYASEAAELVVSSQVGDGAILAWRRDGTAQRLGDADSGDFAGEVRTFVPDAQAPERASHVRVTDAAPLTAFALLTDGVDDPLHPIEQQAPALLAQWRTGSDTDLPRLVQRFRGPVLGTADAGPALAQWLGFEKRGENDDRTAVLFARVGG
ncbi:MAG: PP2C family serine/threonine-protein phosphatase [Gemmatimonadota bacterium]